MSNEPHGYHSDPNYPGHQQQYAPHGYPQQAAYGAPPPGWGPLPPARKKGKALKWVLGSVAVVLGLCMFGACANNADDATESFKQGQAAGAGEQTQASDTSATKKTTAKKAAKTAAIGDAVRDGKFEFTVTGMDCSKTKLGGEYLNSTAQGKYCIVSVSVKNIGDEAQMFSGSSQKAYDAKGTEFSNDGSAEFYANDNNETFINDINPGNKVTGKVVFDVPDSTTLTAVELHDSMFSGGVKVSLK